VNNWEQFDGAALLAGAAALQLDPRNAPHVLQLHELAAIASSLPGAASSKPVSTSRLRKALATEPIPTASAHGDPFEGLFVVEVPFYGRSRLVLQGLAGDSGLMASRVLKAAFSLDRSDVPQGFRLRARVLATFLLDLSDTICRRAGLHAGTVPADDAGPVHIPGTAEVARRSGLLRFSADDLFVGMVPEAVDYLSTRLVRQQGTGAWGGEPVSEALLTHPLVRSGDVVTVGAPGDLATCLRHWLIVEALEWGCGAALATRIAEQAVGETLRTIGVLSDDGLETVESQDGLVELQGVFDEDKRLSVIVLPDDLEGYDTRTPWGEWGRFDALDRVLDKRSVPGGACPDLQLVVTYGIGRDSAFGVPTAELAPTLVADLRDYEVMAGLPETHRLSLWHFARALQRVEEHARVMYFSAIDMFQVYREHGNSFYLSDGPPATFLVVDPGSGQDSRVEFYRRWGARFRPNPEGSGLLEFRPLHGMDTSPILEAWYSPVPICIVDLPIGEVKVKATASPNDLGRTLVEAVAYWLWQIAEDNPALIADASLVVEVEVVERPQAGANAVLDGTRLAVTMAAPRVGEEESFTTNKLDRLLVKAMLRALDAGGDSTSAVDRVAPDGPKTMLHLLNSARDVLRWPGRLRSATRVDESVVAELLDSLGSHLREDRGHAVGPIADEARGTILNHEVVPWFQSRLADEFSSLAPDGLMLGLVERHEALIHESASEEKMLPSRIACFGEGSAEVKALTRHRTALTTATLASRFLIEYAQKVRTAGNGSLNQAAYERLLAISSEIINKGMLSDSIRFGLSSSRLSILESGRLGINQESDRYSRALGAFAEINSGRVLARAVSGYAGDFSGAGPTLDEANKLAQEEYGFTYSEMAATCISLINLAQEQGADDVFDFERTALLTDLTSRIGLSSDVCRRIVDELTLSFGDEEPQEFWGGQGVAPWRFSRPESYLRRPLLVNADRSRLRGGFRATWSAPQAWLDYMRSGRLQATSKEVRGALARLRSEKGEGFEKFIVARLVSLGLEQVKRGVRQIAGLNLRNVEGEDLGDIDVVAVDRSRKRVLLLELKNLEIARTPAELGREVRNVLEGPKSAVERLSRRLSALEPRRDKVLADFGIRDPRGWELLPAVIVNEPLMSGSLRDGGVQVLPASGLDELAPS